MRKQVDGDYPSMKCEGKRLISRLKLEDTNGVSQWSFIYHFYNNESFVKFTDRIFSNLSKDKYKAVTSTITLTELLLQDRSWDQLEPIKTSFLTTPNLQIVEVNQEVALEAARIRREYKLRLPDAIQLATAKLKKAQVFINNDKGLQKFKELKVVVLSKA